jgi:hypothetical protein
VLEGEKRAIRSSGIPALDALLSGGMPRGGVTVIEGGVGARALAAALIAGISGYTVAIVDDATVCPAGLVGAGVRLERVIVVPGRGVSSLVLLRAVDAAMRAGICRAVVLPLGMLALSRGRATRSAWWVRLAELARRSNALLIALCDSDTERDVGAVVASVATLQVTCAPATVLWSGLSGPHARLIGYDVRISVRAYRRDARCVGRSAVVRCLVDEPALSIMPMRACPMPDNAFARARPAPLRRGA